MHWSFHLSECSQLDYLSQKKKSFPSCPSCCFVLLVLGFSFWAALRSRIILSMLAVGVPSFSLMILFSCVPHDWFSDLLLFLQIADSYAPFSNTKWIISACCCSTSCDSRTLERERSQQETLRTEPSQQPLPAERTALDFTISRFGPPPYLIISHCDH